MVFLISPKTIYLRGAIPLVKGLNTLNLNTLAFQPLFCELSLLPRSGRLLPYLAIQVAAPYTHI